MKNLILLTLFAFAFASCRKDKDTQNQPLSCDLQKISTNNASKVTIPSGIWGTVAFMEGNCMPVVPPTTSTCKICPVKRTVRIYEYTMQNQATPQNLHGFYDSFSTRLVKEVDTDDDGFFQTEIPAGHYTIVVIENGKLYTFGLDGQGGLSPITFESGKLNINLTLMYKAIF
jgi:hypothetical protein